MCRYGTERELNGMERENFMIGTAGLRKQCSWELGLRLRFHDAGWRQSQCQEGFLLEVSGFLSYPPYYKAWLYEEDHFPDLPGATLCPESHAAWPSLKMSSRECACSPGQKEHSSDTSRFSTQKTLNKYVLICASISAIFHLEKLTCSCSKQLII